MIAIDGKPINELEAKNPLRKHIEDAFAAIRKKKQWTLVFHNRLIRRKADSENGSYDETSSGIFLKTTQKYSFNGITHDVTYFTGSTMNEKGTHDFRPGFVDFNGSLILDSKKEADRIFAFVCLSPHCGKYKMVEKYQNGGLRQPTYVVQDLLADAKVILSIERNINRVRDLIFNEKLLAEKELRNIAQTFGVSGAKTASDIDLIRVSLKNILLKTINGKYDGKLMDDFIHSVDESSNTTLKAAISHAIELKLIGIKTNSAKDAWYTLTADKKPANRICDVPKLGDQKKELYNFLVADDGAAKEFITFSEAGLPSVDPEK